MELQIAFEPKRPYRFTIEFPQTMEINSSHIKGMSKLEYNFPKGEWEELIISVHDLIGHNNTQKLIESLVYNGRKRFNFMLNCLDPTGVPYESYKICSDLISLNVGTYSYDCKDEINIIKLIVKPTYIESK